MFIIPINVPEYGFTWALYSEGMNLTLINLQFHMNSKFKETERLLIFQM